MSKALFEMTTTDGTILGLNTVDDNHCVIIQNGEVVDTFSADPRGLARAVKKYWKRIDRCGGAHHPFEVLDAANGHPDPGWLRPFAD